MCTRVFSADSTTMGDNFLETWQDVYGAVSPVEQVPIAATALNLAVGGLLAVYLRFLYGKFGAAAKDCTPRVTECESQAGLGAKCGIHRDHH